MLCGPSGCGKSTLLRSLKTTLAPHGQKDGEILFKGAKLCDVSTKDQSGKIGFVMQNPYSQPVTDKVWHELSFGLESLGFDNVAIRKRVAETASFFGMESWFHANVAELSGGQLQLLNLASVMAMQPDVIILDEPTSYLDPVAVTEFTALLGKINRELGTTVILAEHRLEEAFSQATRILVMDEGRIICDKSPLGTGEFLKECGHSMFSAMPTPMRVWAAVENEFDCPLNVRDGRTWLSKMPAVRPFSDISGANGTDDSASGIGSTTGAGAASGVGCGISSFDNGGNTGRVDGAGDTHRTDDSPDFEAAISVGDVWFKYEKELPDAVKGLTFTIKKGEIFALLGGNGVGKTTTLRLLANLEKPYRGKVSVHGSVGMLPQNPRTLFVKSTIIDDLFEVVKDIKICDVEKNERIARMAALCQISDILNRHPYDISGGEQQRAALCKVLLLQPDILIMDEPTKGIDADFKRIFAMILENLKSCGTTVFIVSHDVEFCAMCADRCSLLFDGQIVSFGTPKEFFSSGSFYTTAASRMSRNIIANAVTANDIILSCGGTVPKEPPLDFDCRPPLLPPKDGIRDAAPLPLWRKITAFFAAFALVTQAVRATGATDISFASDLTGAAFGSGLGFLGGYGAVILSLIVFATAVSRRAVPAGPYHAVEIKRKSPPKRTVAAAVMILLLIPLTLYFGMSALDGREYYFIALLVLFECMLPFFLIFEGRKPQARELVVIASLCAISVAGRAAFFMFPQFKPVMALVIISGVAFGGEAGFLVGAMTMLASNVMFSQGPWTPWQMFAMGITGFVAGCLFKKGLLRRTRLSLCTFGAISAIVIYGGIMNPASTLMWQGTVNLKMVMAYYITGLPMDIMHAFGTTIFLWFAAEPMLEKLDRIKVKYGLVE